MEPLPHGQVRFRVHGPDTATDEVSAGVFAHQLTTLVRALKAADKATNGGRAVHDYVVAQLSTSTPTALLAERPLPRYRGQIISGHSGIDAFEDCVEAITLGEERRARMYGACANYVSKFSPVGYSEIWTGETTVFRVDPFLTQRAKVIINPIADAVSPFGQGAPLTRREWFRGVATGSFDGEIKEADLRGALPQIKLILTAGGAEIDCVCRSDNIEDIRATLDRRARVYGRAIYDGSSGLPRRIEVSKIAVVSGSRDLTRWKGAFKPFEIEPWEENE
jgi:hypothetical protein